ncbi:MAG: TonB-dependent receptor plug domain-containing protein [Vicinamibacterales bacterium]
MTRRPSCFVPPRLLPRLAAALCAVALPASAIAQTAADLGDATLEELMKLTVTTASRRAEVIADAPALIEVVTARQIQARGYRSLSDLLRDQLGIKMDLGGDPDYPADITVQGTRNTSRVVLLLDGIRVTSPTNEPLPIMANYPVHNARQVEIVYGPSSALYGADAFSAVVNVISKDAAESAGLEVGTSIGRFGLWNQTASYGQRLGERGSLTVSGQVLRDRQADLSRYYPAAYGGMQGQRTGVFNSIFGPMTAVGVVPAEFANPLAAHSAHVNLRWGRWQAALFNSRSRASTAAGYTPDNAVYADSAYQQNNLWVGSASYSRPLGLAASVSTVTLSQHTLDPSSGYWNTYSNFRRSYKFALGRMAKAEQQLSWKPTPRTALVVGGTFERFFAIPQGADLNAPIASLSEPGTILDTHLVDPLVKLHYSNTGGYVQAQYSPASQLSLTVGSRADYNSRYGATVNPRVGLVARLSRSTTVKLLYGTAFLAPSPYQAYSHYGSFYTTDGGVSYASDYWHLGNPDLEPQRKRTYQATVDQSVGPLLNVSVTAFRSRIDDILKSADPDRAGPGTYLGWPVSYIDFPVNEGEESIYGGNVDVHFLKSWSPSVRLSARAGISLVDGRLVDDDNPDGVPLGAVAPLQFRAGADAEAGDWSASASIMAFGRQRLLATRLEAGKVVRETLPGFFTVDLNLRRNRITRHLSAFVRIENLLDARYVHINERALTNPEELVGTPQSPRRLAVGVDLRIGR